MGTREEEEKVLSDEEDSTFERIEEESQLETSASEDEVEKEEETFEVVQDELVQARAQVERLKKKMKNQNVLLSLLAGILLAIIMHGPPAPNPAPSCPVAPECPVQAAAACPPDSFAHRQILFKREQRENYTGFKLEETFVHWIDKDSNAAAAGLREGDEIVSVNGKETMRMWIWNGELVDRIQASKDTVNMTVRHNSDGMSKWFGAKSRAKNQGNYEGFAEGKKKGIDYGYAQAAQHFTLTGVAALLVISFIGCVMNEIKENKADEDKKKAETAEVMKNKTEIKAVVEEQKKEDKKKKEKKDEKKEETKELEMEEIIERACKVIRAELTAAKDENEGPMKSSAHVDELMRGWLENTLDENLKRNDDLLNL